MLRSPVAWLFFAAGLSFVLRAPFLTVPLITDEGGYAHIARRWLSGRGDLYGDLWFDRPQGIFVAFWLIQETLGTSVEAIRFGAWLVTLASLVVVWAFARDAFNARVANLAAVLFAVLAGSPAIEGFTANAETFMALPAAGVAWLLRRASRDGWRGRTLCLAGLLAGVATLLKPSGIVMLPVGVVFAGLVAVGGGLNAGLKVPRSTTEAGLSRLTPSSILYGSHVSLKEVSRRCLWPLFGFVIAVAPAFVHGWLTGWGDFVAAMTYRLHHRSGTTVSPEEQIAQVIDLAIRIWPLLAAIALLLAARSWRDPRSILRRGSPAPARRWSQADGALGLLARLPTVPAGGEARLLLRLWLLAGLGGVAMGGNWFPHYLVQLAAPLAIALAILMIDATTRFAGGARWVLIGFVFAALLVPYGVVATTRGDADAMSTRMFDRATYPVQDEIATYLRAHTTPEESVYIAFAQASIYYLADRSSAFRHIYIWELPDKDDDLIALLESPDRPRYVVDLGQDPPWPDEGRAFWTTVAAHYRIETVIDGVTIFRAKRD